MSRIKVYLPLASHLESYEWILCEIRMAGRKKIQGTNIYWVPFWCQALLRAEVTTVLNEIQILCPQGAHRVSGGPLCAHVMTIH